MYVDDNGESYQGSWLDGLKHGRGEHTTQDGSTYEGQFLHGMKHGEGRFRYTMQPNQRTYAVYHGQWKDDQRHGNG